MPPVASCRPEVQDDSTGKAVPLEAVQICQSPPPFGGPQILSLLCKSITLAPAFVLTWRTPWVFAFGPEFPLFVLGFILVILGWGTTPCDLSHVTSSFLIMPATVLFLRCFSQDGDTFGLGVSTYELEVTQFNP